ncbi:hypothetical protein NA78x_000735 [Anatilimnocola sp. NA78]|uniref:hypothetical protein n=1 Tax=Anatilimnocola sp. NA78 TaxID=3415683 RepID=UPI003CE490F9
MTIEFPCPQCAQLVRTPDAAAGKRGKCPSCAAVVQIPLASRPPATPPPKPAPGSPSAWPPTKPPTKPATTKPAAPSPPAAAQPPKAEPTKTDPAETGPIEFFCASCGQQVRTPRAAAGKKGKCPHCASVVQIPLSNKAAAASAAARPAARSAQPEIGMAPESGQPEPKMLPKPEAIATAKRTKSSQFTPAKPAETKVVPTVEAPEPVALQPSVILAVPPPQPVTPQQPTTISAKPTPILAPHPKLEPLPPENAGLEPLTDDPFGGPASLPPSTPVDAFTNLPVLTPVGHDAYGGAATLGIPPAPYGLPPNSAFDPNPYQSPQYSQPSAGYPQPGGAGSGDNSTLMLPAIFQMIGAGFTLLLLVLPLFRATYGLFALLWVSSQSMSLESQAYLGGYLAWQIAEFVWMLIILIVQIMIIVGSVGMIQRRGYGNALAAAWGGAIPCIGCCTFPFSIWALVVLYQENIKRSFRS